LARRGSFRVVEVDALSALLVVSVRRPFTLPAASSNTSFENDENVDHCELADTVLNVRECGRTQIH
jgi:hypothetical protein